ncbi:MAG: LD-carboxypeptidase [Flavobacteriales bacterium]|nr:LD-carboxypeptidase [Flavobacteriales bacterium]MCC6939220.1 LD-carboxypeptidase [Flavobacteriales bacterium]
MPDLLLPPALRPGDTIAIIPTARSIVPDELRDGIALAESWGLRVKLGTCVGRKHFQQAGTSRQRAADLQAAIEDPEVKAVWCARGGYGTVHLLQHMDLAAFNRNPKWVIGFSDVTVLHNTLHKLGVASLHAQMPYSLGKKSQEARESLRRALFGEHLSVTMNHTVAERLPEPRTGECECTLVGGNLSLLYALRGTPYDIDPTGKILFLEDLDELLYHVDRMIMNLRLSGWFKNLAGLIVGGMTDMHDKDGTDPFGKTAEEMIAAAIGDATYPVCYNFPAGHIADNRALVMGRKAKLSVTNTGATLSFGSMPLN